MSFSPFSQQEIKEQNCDTGNNRKRFLSTVDFSDVCYSQQSSLLAPLLSPQTILTRRPTPYIDAPAFAPLPNLKRPCISPNVSSGTASIKHEFSIPQPHDSAGHGPMPPPSVPSKIHFVKAEFTAVPATRDSFQVPRSTISQPSSLSSSSISPPRQFPAPRQALHIAPEKPESPPNSVSHQSSERIASSAATSSSARSGNTYHPPTAPAVQSSTSLSTSFSGQGCQRAATTPRGAPSVKSEPSGRDTKPKEGFRENTSHVIFCLDSSGSMRENNRMNDTFDCVMNFISEQMESTGGSSGSSSSASTSSSGIGERVYSLITFSNTPKVHFEKERQAQELIDRVKRLKGNRFT
jgi:hypothetical protein